MAPGAGVEGAGVRHPGASANATAAAHIRQSRPGTGTYKTVKARLCGTYETVKAIFWLRLSGSTP